jgi:hypothetical protein
MAHYACEARFCNPSSGNEKGLVENLVGWARRGILVPIPKVRSWRELNELLAERCQHYIKTHQIKRHEGSVCERYELDKKSLLSLPLKEYEPVKQVDAKVNLYSTVTFENNSYSVPVKWVGRTVTLRANAFTLDIYYRAQLIASHSRSYSKDQTLYDLKHYITILEKKSRSVFNAKPVKAANLPKILEEYSRKLPNPEKAMVRLLRMIVDYGLENVAEAVAKATSEKLYSLDVVTSWLMGDTSPATPACNVGPTVDEVDLTQYDQLIAGGGFH